VRRSVSAFSYRWLLGGYLSNMRADYLRQSNEMNIGGDYEFGRSVRRCVCVSLYTPAITLTSLLCSEAALPSASPFGRNSGAFLWKLLYIGEDMHFYERLLV